MKSLTEKLWWPSQKGAFALRNFAAAQRFDGAGSENGLLSVACTRHAARLPWRSGI